MLSIFRFSLMLYSAGSGVNIVQIALSGLSNCYRYGYIMICFGCVFLVCIVDVMVM